jgi:DNA repair exonuclease SbcCD nuclease subunit
MGDLHLSFPGSEGPPPLAEGADAVLVAGDTCEELARAVETLRRAYPEPVEIVTVAGNHEFHSRRLSYDGNLAEGREAAARHRVHLLERDVSVLENVRILGCTLWTDYLLFGEDLREAAMLVAGATMNDHRRIKWRRDPWMRFRPVEARMLHLESRAFVARELSKSHPGPTICLFHHAVALEALAPTRRRDLVDAAYASDLTSMFESYDCDLVVTGHVHRSFDIRRGATRFLANPAGYAGETTRFDPALVVEVPHG